MKWVLGNVLTLSGNFAQAEVCFNSGLIIAQGLREAQLEGHLLNGLGELRLAQGRFEEATQTLQHALERKRAGSETRILKHTWLSLGALYHQLRQPVEAGAAYEQALSVARVQGDRRIETHTLINLAKLAVAQSQLDRVAGYIEAAAPLAAESEFSDALADLAELRGDLQLLTPEPDYHQLLAHYMEALAHARDFNPATLQRKVDYLVQVIRALADDGQPPTGAQMANDIAHLAGRMGLPSAVSLTFQGLARDLLSSGNINSAS
ncbi:MAG: tetratricopeptide repeat protein [Anaerolineae bacterium]|nr:tetratricopeptide repeat protein [Candidatus Roseilinea sp.]MDW8450665.1 tetratricopeptide repeat protein [Anaerolineae bacterium]